MKDKFHNYIVLISYQFIFLIGSIYFVSFFIDKIGVVEFGQFSLFMGKAGFFSTIIFGPIVSSINRFYYQKEFTKQNLAITFSVRVFFLIVIPFYIFSLLIKNESIIEIFQAFSYAGCLMIFSLYAKYENSHFKRINFVLFKSIPLVLKFSSLIIVLYFCDNFSIVKSLLLFSILISILILIYYFLIAKHYFGDENYREIYVYSKPFILISIFSWIEIYSDRFLIDFYLGTSKMGSVIALKQYFYSTFLIGTTLVQQFATPYVYNGFSIFKFIVKYKLILLSISSIILVLAYFISHEICNIFLKKIEYRSIDLIGFIISGFIYFIANILYLEVDFHKLIKKTILFKLLSTIFFLSSLFIALTFYNSLISLSYLIGNLMFLTLILFLLWSKRSIIYN